MNIRFATPADAPELAAVEQTQPQAAGWGLAGFTSELQQPCARVWCAQDQDQIVGFLALRSAAGSAEILNVAVAPQHCRRGIGQQLLLRALDWVRERGGKEITLEVATTNLPAVCLYQKVGFVQVGVRKKFYNGNTNNFLRISNLGDQNLKCKNNFFLNHFLKTLYSDFYYYIHFVETFAYQIRIQKRIRYHTI